MANIDLARLTSPILLVGNEHTAYRDPAAIYHDGVFRLFYTRVETEADGAVYMYTAMSQSEDLVHWSESKLLTPRDRRLNFRVRAM